jgi:hypothetical protein
VALKKRRRRKEEKNCFAYKGNDSRENGRLLHPTPQLPCKREYGLVVILDVQQSRARLSSNTSGMIRVKKFSSPRFYVVGRGKPTCLPGVG